MKYSTSPKSIVINVYSNSIYCSHLYVSHYILFIHRRPCLFVVFDQFYEKLVIKFKGICLRFCQIHSSRISYEFPDETEGNNDRDEVNSPVSTQLVSLIVINKSNIKATKYKLLFSMYMFVMSYMFFLLMIIVCFSLFSTATLLLILFYRPILLQLLSQSLMNAVHSFFCY